MADHDIFISSCSRREMARRRAQRGAVRGVVRGSVRLQLPVAPIQLLMALVFIAVAFGAFVAGHGGV